MKDCFYPAVRELELDMRIKTNLRKRGRSRHGEIWVRQRAFIPYGMWNMEGKVLYLPISLIEWTVSRKGISI